MRILLSSLLIITYISIIYSSPSPELPGKELSNKEYLDYIAEKTIDSSTITEDEHVDTSALFRTWNAPSPADQLAKDTVSLKFGMGAVFVPRMSEDGAIEPNLLIKDDNGKIIASGQTGRKFNLLPGHYKLHIGNLEKQVLIRDIVIKEGEITPLIPDWCALRIEIIDESAKPIRGDYELATITPLAIIGRGKGRDIDLAEPITVWFLPIGTYKIIGTGASANSISNFLTVRLTTPGEFVRYTVVQDQNDHKILGGGIMISDENGYQSKRWKHNINIGGSIDLNYSSDYIQDTTNNYLGMSILLYDIINYKKDKLEINNLLKLDMELSMDKFDFSTLRSSVDELRITTLFTYRVFPRIGPYGRGEYVSGILSKRYDGTTIDSDNPSTKSSSNHAFLYYDSIPDIIDDNTDITIDTTSEKVIVSPLLSPINLQSGLGINFQVFQNRILNTRFLTGFGIDYETKWDSWDIESDSNLTFDSTSSIYNQYYANNSNHSNLIDATQMRFDYGPEILLNNYLYLNRFISSDTEIRLFIPLARYTKPDLVLRNLLSLHLTSNIIIDYDYKFTLVQASQEKLQTNSSRHRILLRISFSR